MRLAFLLAPVLAFAAGPVVDATWAAANQSRLVFVEAAWLDGKTATNYLREHIPGAVLLDTDRLEDGYPRWLLRPLAELHNVIGSLGIGRGREVVVYGRDSVTPARVWWVLHYAGVPQVYYLNGGLAAWRRAGFPVESGPVRRPAERFEALPRTEALASTGEVLRSLGRPGVLVADVRSTEEWSGKSSGYRYLELKGRIQGALHAGNAGDAARIYQNPDGTLKPPAEVAARWKKLGITAGGNTIFYCGSGWRSSLAYLYAHQLGWRNIRNYSDGWTGWSTIHEPAPGIAGITPGWRQWRTTNPVD